MVLHGTRRRPLSARICSHDTGDVPLAVAAAVDRRDSVDVGTPVEVASSKPTAHSSLCLEKYALNIEGAAHQAAKKAKKRIDSQTGNGFTASSPADSTMPRSSVSYSNRLHSCMPPASTARTARALHDAATSIRTRSARMQSQHTPEKYSHRQVVLGAGFGSTGTDVIASALQLLGLTSWRAPEQYTARVRYDGRPTDTVSSQLLPSQSPNSFRTPITNAWKLGAGSSCHAELDRLDYRLPEGVDAYLDRPSAEVGKILLGTK